jgi:type 1 glutamine amidotransferase
MIRFVVPRSWRRMAVSSALIAMTGVVVACAALKTSRAQATPTKRLLVVTVTKGFRHDCIPVSEEVLQTLAEKDGAFSVDYVRTDAEMAQKMTPDGLKNYDAVFFANTTGELPLPDREAFLQWIADGHGFVGAHAATDTYHKYEPYLQMIGAEFKTHGPQSKVECRVEDKTHPATRHLEEKFTVFDEIYQFKNYDRSRFHGLLALDKHPNTGAPGDYPIAWSRAHGKGRVFYTALGHRQDVWRAPWYQDHLRGGIRWALGLEKSGAEAQTKTPQTASEVSDISAEEKRDGFRSVFNGRDLSGWHLRRKEGKPSWSVQDGVLVNAGKGTDLVSDETFGDHTVRYEYSVPKGGNSGFYLRGRYEIQVADDFDRKKPDIRGNGSIYNKVAPSVFASKPAGEWQQAEATIIGNRVTVILNGAKIIDNAAIEGVTGAALDKNVTEPGPILLQGDHSAVRFRNIRVKPIRPTVSPLTPAAPAQAAR